MASGESTAGNPSRDAARPSPYFVNAPVDLFLVSGASLATFAAMLAFGWTALTPTVITINALLLWVVNYPHFSMSSYRLYHSRANIRQFPVTAIVIPLVMLGAVAASFAYPNIVAPMFVKLFIIWSPYHFSGQTVGITLIYARRNGVSITGFQRMVLSAFVFGTFAFSTLRSETHADGYDFLSIHYPGLGVPQWIVQLSEWGMWAAGVAFLCFVIGWSIRNRRILPLMIVLPALTQYVWFVSAAYTPAFKQLVPMFHSLQYILIAWGMQLMEKMEAREIAPSRRYVGAESLRWYGLNLVGGFALFWAMPHLAGQGGHTIGFATAVVISAVQIHHFFVDGVIWKLKNRTNSSPLMMNVADVLGTSRTQRAGRSPA